MTRKGNNTEHIKTIPNAKRKLVIMIISIGFMIFSVTQVYYLAKYTLGYQISSENMAVYNWVLGLVTYDAETDQSVDYIEAE